MRLILTEKPKQGPAASRRGFWAASRSLAGTLGSVAWWAVITVATIVGLRDVSAALSVMVPVYVGQSALAPVFGIYARNAWRDRDRFGAAFFVLLAALSTVALFCGVWMWGWFGHARHVASVWLLT